MSRLSIDPPLRTPVLFVIFNRPDTTRRVFDAIRAARPERLFIAADGPRAGRADDAERCRAARAVVEHVDWDCDVQTKLGDANVGLKRAVVSAVDWFFEHVPEGIILEDDCLPSPSFFPFCQALLARYRDDERVMQVSGNNYLMGRRSIRESYYFSRLSDIWGWATWRRAWRWFDLRMETYPRFRDDGRLGDYIVDAGTAAWLTRYFDDAYRASDERGIWSTAWMYAMVTQNALTIVPRVNLVANIGFGGDGTNVARSFRPYAEVSASTMDELVHPPFVLPDHVADALRFDVIRRTEPRLAARRNRLRELAGRYMGKRVRQRLIAMIRGQERAASVAAPSIERTGEASER